MGLRVSCLNSGSTGSNLTWVVKETLSWEGYRALCRALRIERDDLLLERLPMLRLHAEVPFNFPQRAEHFGNTHHVPARFAWVAVKRNSERGPYRPVSPGRTPCPSRPPFSRYGLRERPE